MTEWKHIATAPRDGTYVWLSDRKSIRMAFWEIHSDAPALDRWVDFAKVEAGAPSDLAFVPIFWTSVPDLPE